MPDQKISQMDPAAALTGAELVPAVQSGGNVRTTTQDIANLVSLSSLGASANGITLIGHTFAQMRADLDLEAGTDFVAYSAYSANALTLIGHTFAQMRTDLSLVPGTDVQVYSAKLAALAAQTWAADTITYQTSTSAVSTTALTAFGRSLIDDADAATARTTLGLVIGTNVQAYNANLTTYAGIAPSANAQTLLGHTFSQMRTDLGLVIGTDVQAYDANTAKLNAIQTWSQAQTFSAAARFNGMLGVGMAPIDTLDVSGNGRFLGVVYPQTDNAYSLGFPTNAWALVYIGNGGVINANNGNATITHSSGRWAVNVPWGLASYTVAALPAGTAGDTAYASNGRKNGEGAGAGTGVLVFKDGTAWRACDTGATVAA